MDNTNQLIQERVRKLKEIQDKGINPYAYSFNKTHSSSELHEKYKDLQKAEETDDNCSFAGRIMQLRRMGKASFATVQDEFGRMQIYFQQDTLGKQEYKFLKKIDIGDIVGVEGTIFKTKTGELTIKVKRYKLLSKSIRPLPEKFHGLKDTELRYRQRYLDLIMNPEVKTVFKVRSAVTKAFREFLDSRGFIEVETPVLQPVYGGANAKPFETYHNALNMKLYLRISNELYLKRLIVGGFEKVYEFVHDFRNEGIDTTHNPEFTQIEWYEAYKDYKHGMKMFEEIISYAAKRVLGTTKIEFQGTRINLKPPWKRLRMVDAIKEYAKIDVLNMSREELLEYCKTEGIEFGSDSWGMLVASIFEEKCESELIQPTFIIDHPIETTPLCKPLRSGDTRFVERFEPYINGWEVGNAYSELNDPILQKKLLEDQEERGRGGEDETHPMDTDFVKAIEHGMPPTSGVGVGFDRIIMLFTNNPSIRDVILFPTMKPKEEKR